MISSPQLLHRHLGSPPRAECIDIPTREVRHCWVCGGSSFHRGIPTADFGGASFVGQNRVRAWLSPWVCEPCVYFCSRTEPVPGRPAKEGKKFGANYRNLSHLYDDVLPTPYVNASKGEKPVILAWLRQPHAGTWFAAIADSGQKHTIPWAPLNPPGSRGRVLFDEQTITLPDADGWRIVDDLIALLTAGATKEEIGAGHYSPRAWFLCGDQIRAFEATWGTRLRGGDWFDLALWLAQRDEDAVEERLAAEQATKAEKKARAKAAAKTEKPRRTKPATSARSRGTRAPRAKTAGAEPSP